LQKVEELENRLSVATATLQQQEVSEISDHEGHFGQSQVVVRIQEPSASAVSTDPGLSPSLPTISCSSPTSPSSSLLTSQPPHSVDTSPSFRSLNPGYVSSLAEFWANKWKMEINECSKACQKEHDHDQGLENGDKLDEVSHEVNHLKETIMIQCNLFRAAEEENFKLKEDLKNLPSQYEEILTDRNLKVEILKNKENTIANLRANLKDCNEEVSMLLEKDLFKNSKIIELEEKLEKSVHEKIVLDNDKHKMEQDSKENKNKFEDLKVKYSKTRKELDDYEERVKDLKNQLVPIENLKVKMGSLDQDVKLLRTKLQNSFRSSSKCLKTAKTANLTTTLPNRSSTKRRWSATVADQDVASPAKVIKMAETEFMEKKSVKTAPSANSREGSRKIVSKKQESDLEFVKSSTLTGKSLKTKSKFGRNLEDCKQQ